MTAMEMKYYAFFDVDGTLLKGKPMLDFLNFYYQKRYYYFPIIGKIKCSLFRAKSVMLKLIDNTREAQNKLYYKCFKGQARAYIENLGKEWFVKSISNESYFLNVVNELKQHKLNNAVIVLVSGSFSACLHQIAQILQVDYTLATELEEKSGKYTGKLVSEPVIGVGKHNAILRFLLHRDDVDLKKCFAYGDHISDVPMLSLVGNPCVITRDRELEEIATNNNWKIIYPA